MHSSPRTASFIAFLLPAFVAMIVSGAQAGQTADGIGPVSGLLPIGKGRLVGTTPYGGAHDLGTVYELASNGSGYTESILYLFAGRNDGAHPSGGLVADASGNLYGTTSTGGRGFECCGTVYLLTANFGYSKTTLYDFQGKKDGTGPQGRLLLDASGSIYGAAVDGGGKKAGMVFKLAKNGQSYAESVLYRFQGGDDGNEPQGSLIADQQGSLYGTTFVGGSDDWGTAFALKPAGSKYTRFDSV